MTGHRPTPLFQESGRRVVPLDSPFTARRHPGRPPPGRDLGDLPRSRYRDLILGWCLHRGLPPDAAEDLTQDVLVKLFEQLPRHRHDPDRGPFRGWLKTVVNNALTDFWRRTAPARRPRGRRHGVPPAARPSVASPDAAGELSEAIEGHARATAAAVLERVRGKLKETTWQAFYQSVAETARPPRWPRG